VSELLERALRVLEDVRSGEEIEVFVSRGVDTDVQAYQGSVEKLSTASSSGLGVRVLRATPSGARVGSAWVGSLDDAAVSETLQQARDNLRFVTEDEFVTFASPDGVAPASLSLRDDTVATTPLDEKIAMAIDLEQSVRHADPRIRQVDSASYSDYVVEAAIASTMGIRATYEKSGVSLSVEAIASDGVSDQTGWGLSVARGPAWLNPTKASDDAVRRATRMLGAIKPPSMKCPAVFSSRATATLLAVVGGALSGESVVRGRSLFAGRVGENVAAAGFTLSDDPTDPRHFGASQFDGEGLACRRNVLIDDGVLRGFVFDTVAGRRYGTSSTGSAVRGGIAGSPSAGCRALQLVAGELSEAEILARVGTGVYVESLSGVHSGVNPVSGDFSVGVTGLMIREGQLAEPIREITVASTLQRMLLDVLYVGNDVEWLPGTAAGQTLALDGIAVSGT